MPEVEDKVEFRDLSPEAMQVQRNLRSKATALFAIGRIQAIVEEWREIHPYVNGIVDSRGRPVKMPQIVATEGCVADLDRMMKPLIQDMCEDSENAIRDKIRVLKQRSDFDGSAVVKSLDTALAAPRGDLTIRPTPDRSNR